jgi:hypothetical protein
MPLGDSSRLGSHSGADFPVGHAHIHVGILLDAKMPPRKAAWPAGGPLHVG